MTKFALALFFLTFFFSCAKVEKNNSHQKLDGFFTSYWEEHSRLYPLDATQQGDNRFNDLLPNDQAPEFREKLKSFYTGYLEGLHRFNRNDLDENDRLSYDIFEYEMSMQLEWLRLNSWMIPFQQFWGLPLTMGQLGSGEQFQPFKTVQDYRNWISRLDAFSPWADSAIANFREGMKTGVVLPKILIKRIIPQLKDMIVKDPKKSLFFAPIKKLPASFSASEKKELTDLYTRTIKDTVVPTFKRLHTFMTKEYKGRDSHGITAVPGGKDLYTFLVRYWTTTDKTPEEIYQTGLTEVKRIRTEMESVKESVGFKGDLKSFFKHLRTDPKLMPFKKDEDVLNAFRKIHEKLKPQLATMFGRVPKTPFEIRQTEEFREASASAEYSSGSADGSRPGIFYIPILDPKKFNITSGMESLFLHEAIPGHHYQISLQQENEALPKFRRFAWYGAYGEGWALYTESLGKELGLYTDPYQYMGALGDEMHRAVRLVVDVAIHTKGMKRDEAIKYMMENEQIDLQGATAEIERYMAVPAQALSYKIGALKIRELRNKYQKTMDGKFRLSDFHDEFLKDGCMPLRVVENKMDAWASTK